VLLLNCSLLQELVHPLPLCGKTCRPASRVFSRCKQISRGSGSQNLFQKHKTSWKKLMQKISTVQKKDEHRSLQLQHKANLCCTHPGHPLTPHHGHLMKWFTYLLP